MKIEKENFLIQVKYSDLASDAKDLAKYFLGFGGELYLSAEEISNPNTQILNSINLFVKTSHLPLRLHGPIKEIDYSQIEVAVSLIKPLYKKVIRLCRDLNINSIVTHADFNYHIDFPIDKQLENAVYLWRILCEECRANDIHINIENHCEIKPDHLIAFMERINSPYFGMCIDIGHSNAFSNLGIKKWLEKYPPGSIKEVHLADNAGDDDTHLPLGKGNIDFIDFFETLAGRDRNYVFVLEPNNLPEARKSLSFLRKGGFIE